MNPGIPALWKAGGRSWGWLLLHQAPQSAASGCLLRGGTSDALRTLSGAWSLCLGPRGTGGRDNTLTATVLTEGCPLYPFPRVPLRSTHREDVLEGLELLERDPSSRIFQPFLTHTLAVFNSQRRSGVWYGRVWALEPPQSSNLAFTTFWWCWQCGLEQVT